MPVITFKNKQNYYAIYFNGILHLLIKKSDFIGFQSYKKPSSEEERRVRGFKDSKYTIEYYLKTTSITCEYDTIEKWTEILNLLNLNIKQ